MWSNKNGVVLSLNNTAGDHFGNDVYVVDNALSDTGEFLYIDGVSLLYRDTANLENMNVKVLPNWRLQYAFAELVPGKQPAPGTVAKLACELPSLANIATGD